ncbi:SDR family NAD(P)-dependent oxidoreductase [Burkholderia sp. Bp9142]|uniref:SDR family NAD(P)-dependent oxidoreductase n=1 Tax=Burkholderia sp. Bp9142 TaxID=2184573 RepID=UPI000F5B01D1|nr:SDR family NAD(P)-dependent oxidoreductase [Burkholderia sp. Bp9142]RQR27592.1 SDR family NAD(P)-dependent oxidoreductase [Burkholderia sp. Bp9142]
MKDELKGKVIVVTGAFGNLGMVTAITLTKYGATVALVDSNQAPAGQIPGALSDALVLGEVDLSSYDLAHSAMSTVSARYGEIYGVVNVAGAFRWSTVEGDEVDAWDNLFNANLKTALMTSKAVLPYLRDRDGGRIVNIGAAAAAKGVVGMGPYAASKSAVARLTEALADELKDRSITVNAILPSVIDTPINREIMPDADFQRWVTPDAVAEVIAFLMSRRSAAITGALIPVSGRM